MRAIVVFALVVVLTGCASSTTSHRPAQSLSGSIGAAAYEIDVPQDWNGTLFLFSHGYVMSGGSNPAQAAPNDQAKSWLLGRHYAVAGSSYSSTGWAVEDALKDQIALLDFFNGHLGKPRRVIAWGASLGGIITAGLIQLHPERFAAAMPLCGVLSGGVATWNAELDAAYAFKTLLAPQSSLQLVHIGNGTANFQLARKIFGDAAATPKGQARLALAGALIDLPGWFDPTQPEPGATDYQARGEAMAAWEGQVDFAFAFRARQELETRAGGNPSWTFAGDYTALLNASPDRDAVAALYLAAGLDLTSDLSALNAGKGVNPDPAAVSYLDRNISFDGSLRVPVLSMHTTGDGLVIPANETAYAQVVSGAGHQDNLRQVFVHRAGHCTFTAGETIAALQVLLKRLDTGKWNDGTLMPSALNASALAQGGPANSFFGRAFPPAFVAYQPGPYPRPFPKGATIPT